MGELLAQNAADSYQPRERNMANEALSHGRAGTRGGVGLPLHAVEHRLANAYRSMQVVGGPPTGLARIKELATRTAAG